MIDVIKYKPVVDEILAKTKARWDQSEDLEQECYLALLERQSELGKEDDLEKAKTICRSRITAIKRERTQRSTKKENRIKFVSADDPNIAKQLAKIPAIDEGEISEAELREGIQSLDRPERDAVWAVFIDGLTLKGSAQKLGITEEAVRWRRDKGIQSLKKYFEVK